LAVAGYDELWSGMAVVAAPGVEQAHRVDHVQYTLFVFTVPLLAASLIEAPLMLLSDRAPRRGLVASGLAMLAVALMACAFARSALWLSIGLALAGAASGVACAEGGC
jgi:MFS family permease